MIGMSDINGINDTFLTICILLVGRKQLGTYRTNIHLFLHRRFFIVPKFIKIKPINSMLNVTIAFDRKVFICGEITLLYKLFYRHREN